MPPDFGGPPTRVLAWTPLGDFRPVDPLCVWSKDS